MGTGGDVGMHDLGPRVTGRRIFLPHHVRTYFAKKNCKTRKKHAQQERRPGIIPKHHDQMQKRARISMKRTQTTQIQRLQILAQTQ